MIKYPAETSNNERLNSKVLNTISEINNKMNNNIITDTLLGKLANALTILVPSHWNAENCGNVLALISPKK